MITIVSQEVFWEINAVIRLLRKRAQRFLTSSSSDAGIQSQEDVRKLVYELDTYHIALELQNEELRIALNQLEESRQHFIDFYNYAPVGFLTVSDHGQIIKANITAFDMFRETRLSLYNRPFTDFIFSEDQDLYYKFRKLLVEKKTKQICELRMLKKDGDLFVAQVVSVVSPFEDGEEYQLQTIITNISEKVLDGS